MADQNTNVNLIVKNEEEQREEVVVSLASVFRKLKKYFVAWFLTAIIVGGLITGVSVFFSTTSSTPVRALVSFTHNGIEKGKNPDGSVFDLCFRSVRRRSLRIILQAFRLVPPARPSSKK